MSYLAMRENILGDGDKSWVELQDMMPNPRYNSGNAAYLDLKSADRAVVQAARVSFLGDSKGDEADKKLLFYLLEHHHTSPFEQVEFKFRVRAPVVVFWQWTRHRVWNYNFQSGRYTEFEEDDFYIPKEWRLQSKNNKQGSDGVLDNLGNEIMQRRMNEIVEDGFNHYQHALELGVAKEQARFFLPAWTSYYTAVCKVDAWNLMNFLRLRTAPDAQFEIRQYANALHTIFSEFMPWTSSAFDKFILGLDK